MHGNEVEFLQGIAGFLGSYYLVLAAMNGVAAYHAWHHQHKNGQAIAWTLLALLFTLMSPLAYTGDPALSGYISLPVWFRELANLLTRPEVFSGGALIVLGAMYYFRRYLVDPPIAWLILNASLLLMGLSMTDMNFAAIVTKPDNVPIVGLVFLLGFFTWLATHRAVQNDDRMARGEPPLEALDNEKVLVWPDLVYTELICMVAITALLIFWAIALQAPLEEPASSVKTPNPSKAPWYFLGLQEMLVYYDPWMAGVVAPSVIVFGLMAIPYIDFNKEGNGYYTIEQRPFAYLMFQFGFFNLWVILIVLGTFLRGPNWNIFGPYEYWDSHKVLALNNVDLSQYFWIEWLGMARPQAGEGASEGTKFGYILLRELPGILSLFVYFVVLPPLMAMTFLRTFFLKMGFLRYMVLANLLLLMASLPIKMVLRWTVNLKYIVSIPEYFLNF